MASKERIDHAMALMKATYRFDFGEDAYDGAWRKVMSSLTDEQLVAGLDHMLEHHQSQRPPMFATFKAWAVGSAITPDQALQWWKTHEVATVQDSQGRWHALSRPVTNEKGYTQLQPILEPKTEHKPEIISTEERAKRSAALKSLMTVDMPGLAAGFRESFRNLRPEDMERRIELRKALGWSLTPEMEAWLRANATQQPELIET